MTITSVKARKVLINKIKDASHKLNANNYNAIINHVKALNNSMDYQNTLRLALNENGITSIKQALKINKYNILDSIKYDNYDSYYIIRDAANDNLHIISQSESHNNDDSIDDLRSYTDRHNPKTTVIIAAIKVSLRNLENTLNY